MLWSTSNEVAVFLTKHVISMNDKPIYCTNLIKGDSLNRNLWNSDFYEEIFDLVVRSVECRPSINAVASFSWDDMDMEMWHRLTCTFVTCVQQVHSIISTSINAVIGNLFHRCHQATQGFNITIENAFHMLLGDCNHMAIYILGDIHEDQGMLIFIHLETGNISVYDFTEYTIHCSLPPSVILCHIQAFLIASVEGTKTETLYFKFAEIDREQLGIDAIVHIEVLRRHDTKSDPENVLELLEEYVQFRNENMFEKEIASLRLRSYTPQFIRSYLDDPSNISTKERRRFEAVLREEHIDLLYLDFLSKYQGNDDIFGIVIDRDCGSHTIEQMSGIMSKCREKNYLCYVSNPCIEFWQLLHVSDVATEYSGQLDAILENKLDEQKNSYISNLLWEKQGREKPSPIMLF